MYRVFLFFAFLAYCSSAPYNSLNFQKPLPVRQEKFFGQQQQDDSEIVDNTGGGYSFFKKQNIDSRPFVSTRTPAFDQDISEYMKASAFKEQLLPSQILGRSNLPIQTLVPQLRPFTSNEYGNQQQDLFRQSDILSKNVFDNQQLSAYGQSQQKDLRPLWQQKQQIVLPQANLNFQPKTFTDDDSSQENDLSFIQQPKPTWSSQRQSTGFSSSYGGQGRQPVSSSFLIQSNQQNEMKPLTTGVFISSQVPTQRFISQSQPMQKTSFSSSSTNW